MRKQTFLALLISVLLVNGFFSTNIIKSNHKFYANQIDDLISKNDDLNLQLNEFYKYGIEVDVTMYQPVVRQTDNTPNVTADGTRIRISRASDYKFVALSRNLLSRWGGPFNYGDFILIKGTDKKDGVYQVRDTMNKRYVNRIDILESIDVKPYKFEKASIVKTDLIVNSGT